MDLSCRVPMAFHNRNRYWAVAADPEPLAELDGFGEVVEFGSWYGRSHRSYDDYLNAANPMLDSPTGIPWADRGTVFAISCDPDEGAQTGRRILDSKRGSRGSSPQQLRHHH